MTVLPVRVTPLLRHGLTSRARLHTHPTHPLCARKQLSKAADVSRELEFDATRLESARKCLMEFNSGAGGVEAMHFTGDLMRLYEKYSHRRDWLWRPMEVDSQPKGGVRSAIIAVEGDQCYTTLRFEAGVHRVQRCPATDPSRVHTSTASIVVMPEMEDVSVVIR